MVEPAVVDEATRVIGSDERQASASKSRPPGSTWPKAAERLACGSMSTKCVAIPHRLNSTAKAAALVVLPVPPF